MIQCPLLLKDIFGFYSFFKNIPFKIEIFWDNFFSPNTNSDTWALDIGQYWILTEHFSMLAVTHKTTCMLNSYVPLYQHLSNLFPALTFQYATCETCSLAVLWGINVDCDTVSSQWRVKPVKAPNVSSKPLPACLSAYVKRDQFWRRICNLANGGLDSNAQLSGEVTHFRRLIGKFIKDN